MIAQIHDLGRIDILADGQFARRDDTFALEADVNQHLVVLELHHRTLDQVTLVEIGQCAIDHGIELVVGYVVELDDGRVLDLGQNGPLSEMRDPVPISSRLGQKLTLLGADTLSCLRFHKPSEYITHYRTIIALS